MRFALERVHAFIATVGECGGIEIRGSSLDELIAEAHTNAFLHP